MGACSEGGERLRWQLQVLRRAEEGVESLGRRVAGLGSFHTSPRCSAQLCFFTPKRPPLCPPACAVHTGGYGAVFLAQVTH